ncbi:hypothetical protein H920_17934 [Fukomys damarensis]|uniref:Uncharacterized protein n=1 Tax=Fukomys damarensis TaxID=885580 RepID=A0A091CS48_FUKDA|nr:hypothetical protein H920_17934 [Fukomys damarensis]
MGQSGVLCGGLWEEEESSEVHVLKGNAVDLQGKHLSSVSLLLCRLLSDPGSMPKAPPADVPGHADAWEVFVIKTGFEDKQCHRLEALGIQNNLLVTNTSDSPLGLFGQKCARPDMKELCGCWVFDADRRSTQVFSGPKTVRREGNLTAANHPDLVKATASLYLVRKGDGYATIRVCYGHVYNATMKNELEKCLLRE